MASLYLRKMSNSKRSYSEVLGFRTPSYLLRENTAQSIAATNLHVWLRSLDSTQAGSLSIQYPQLFSFVKAQIMWFWYKPSSTCVFSLAHFVCRCIFILGKAASVTQGSISPTKRRAGEYSVPCFTLRLEEHPVHCDHINMNMKE